MRRTQVLRAVLASGFALALTALPARAQVTFTSATSFKLGGAMGKMVSFAAKLGGGSTNNTTTTYLSGHKMRTDGGNSSTIIDADAGTITVIDNKAKSYSVMTFEEMAAALDAMSAQMKASYAQAKEDAKKNGDEVPDIDLKYDVSVDRTGEKETIAGYPAEHAFITLTVETRAAPEGETEKQDAGSLVVLIDTWNSTSAPTAAAQKEFQEAYAKRVQRDFSGATRMLSAAFAADPRIAKAMEASAKELRKLPGASVKSTTYVVGVPPEQKFDRQLALGEASAEKPKESTAKKAGKGLFGKLKQAAAEAAKQDQEQEQEADQKAAPKQGTLLTTSTELKEIKTGALPASTFEVPAEYKKVESELQKQH